MAGKAPCHKIWEDDDHLAFLSIFPNTDGFSVVIPKAHHPSYAFDLPDEVLSALMLATKRVAKQLDRAFDDVGRCGMVFEGYGVDHVHAKLIRCTAPRRWISGGRSNRPRRSFSNVTRAISPPTTPRAPTTIGWRRWPPASAKAPFKARTINAGH